VVRADTVPEVDVLRGVLFCKIEGSNEAAEDGTEDFLPCAWLCSKGRQFVDPRKEGFPIGLFSLECDAWDAAHEGHREVEVRF